MKTIRNFLIGIIFIIGVSSCSTIGHSPDGPGVVYYYDYPSYYYYRPYRPYYRPTPPPRKPQTPPPNNHHRR